MRVYANEYKPITLGIKKKLIIKIMKSRRKIDGLTPLLFVCHVNNKCEQSLGLTLDVMLLGYSQ